MAKVQRITFLTVRLKDEPGTVLTVMHEIKKKDIALKSLLGLSKQVGEQDQEVIFVAKNTDKLRNALAGLGLSPEEGTAFFFKGPDKTGVLLRNLEALTNAHVSMKSINAIAVSGNYGSIIWVDPADVEKAAQALGAK